MSDEDRYGARIYPEYPEELREFRAKWTQTEEKKPVSVVSLPHQCDDWVIGGKTEVRLLIRDLKALIMEGPFDG